MDGGLISTLTRHHIVETNRIAVGTRTDDLSAGPVEARPAALP